MISLDYTIVFQVINFLILIFILNNLLYKPTIKIINKRNQQINDAQGECERLETEIIKQKLAYEEKLNQARIQAIEEKNRLVKVGDDHAKKILSQSSREIPELMSEYHKMLENEVACVRDILRLGLPNTAAKIAEKVLGRSLSMIWERIHEQNN